MRSLPWPAFLPYCSPSGNPSPTVTGLPSPYLQSGFSQDRFSRMQSSSGVRLPAAVQGLAAPFSLQPRRVGPLKRAMQTQGSE